MGSRPGVRAKATALAAVMSASLHLASDGGMGGALGPCCWVLMISITMGKLIFSTERRTYRQCERHRMRNPRRKRSSVSKAQNHRRERCMEQAELILLRFAVQQSQKQTYACNQKIQQPPKPFSIFLFSEPPSCSTMLEPYKTEAYQSHQ